MPAGRPLPKKWGKSSKVTELELAIKNERSFVTKHQLDNLKDKVAKLESLKNEQMKKKRTF